MIVLDTHVLIWWLTDAASLTSVAHRAIEEAVEKGEVVISSITAWEIALLVQKERLGLVMDIEKWLEMVASIDGVRFYPVDNDIAVKSVALPGEFHKDHADRLIVATARKLGFPLVTADEKIRHYPHVRTIW